MKTQYYTASSLDGFIADAEGSLDWLLQFGDIGETSYPAFILEVGALAMGSHTYEWLLRNQLQPENAPAQAWMYEQPAWVFTSRSLPRVEGDIRFVDGDVRAVHAAMVQAAGGKNVWIVGGGDLAGQFLDHGLLEEVIVQYAPVTLGAGAPLLPRRVAKPSLRVIATDRFGPFVEVRYEVPKQ